jgi:FkbM family methyltransferase
MPVREFGDCQRTLDQFRPQIGQYRWLWPILRFRARQIEGFLPRRLLARLKPFCRRPYFIGRMSDGTRFVGDLNDGYSAWCGLNPNHEMWLVQLLEDLADRHPGSFLDVGSNQGAVAAAVGRHLGPGRKLFAFEPVPETAARAAATLALNELRGASLVPLAIGERDEPVTFHCRAGHSDLATARRVNEEQGEFRQVSVDCRRLDSLLRDVVRDRVGVVKIDVEGFEWKVMCGAQQLIHRDRPAIVFEYWPEVAGQLGWQAEDVAELITSAGGAYTFQAYEQNRPIAYPPPSNGGIYNVVALPVSATR